MNVNEMVQRASDAIAVRRVYGEPIERDGTLVIPAAMVRGGGGGGDAQNNGGGGFGVSARPAGAFVVRPGGEVAWHPAIDVNRIVLGGQVAAVIGLLVLRSILRARSSR
jgi:uncharacterized spore protein YtfJ